MLYDNEQEAEMQNGVSSGGEKIGENIRPAKFIMDHEMWPPLYEITHEMKLGHLTNHTLVSPKGVSSLHCIVYYVKSKFLPRVHGVSWAYR